MKKICMLFAGLASLSLVGCVSTPAKPLSFDQLGQFSQIPLNRSTYRISFQANPHIHYGMAEEIILVKAAQTTVQQGYRFFKVLNDPSSQNAPPRQTVVYAHPVPYSGYGYYPRYRGFWPDPFYETPRVVDLDPVQVSYHIQCFKDQKSAPSDAFDATLILSSLGGKYRLNTAGEPLPSAAALPSGQTK